MHLNLSKMFSKTCIGFMVGLLVACVGSIPVETPAKPLAKTPTKPAPKDSRLGMILPPGMGGCNIGMNCPMTMDPVCATDGQTYPNMCVLRSIQSCHPMPMIYLKHHGRCGSRPCMVHCPNTYNPVCGSDGNTYNSKCLLDRERMCGNKPNLYLVRYGRCSMLPPCRSSCPKLRHPVCGNDGKTYDNTCELDNSRRCDNKPYLRVLHNGHCTPPPSCRRVCPLTAQKVCGTDDKTYENACELDNVKRCDNKPGLHVQHVGPCAPKPCLVHCLPDVAPVCGTDGKTYMNSCLLGAAKRCENKPSLAIDHFGPC